MTKLLEQALSQLQGEPSTRQDTIAALILDELSDERKWDDTFAASQDKLGRSAAKARADIAAGKVRTMGIDEL